MTFFFSSSILLSLLVGVEFIQHFQGLRFQRFPTQIVGILPFVSTDVCLFVFSLKSGHYSVKRCVVYASVDTDGVTPQLAIIPKSP